MHRNSRICHRWIITNPQSFWNPKRLITDCGAAIISKGFQQMRKALDIEQLFTASYQPTTHGMVERLERDNKKSKTSVDRYFLWRFAKKQKTSPRRGCILFF